MSPGAGADTLPAAATAAPGAAPGSGLTEPVRSLFAQPPSVHWTRAPSSLPRPVTSRVTWPSLIPHPHLFSPVRTVLPSHRSFCPSDTQSTASSPGLAHVISSGAVLFFQVALWRTPAQRPLPQRPPPPTPAAVLGKASPNPHHSTVFS